MVIENQAEWMAQMNADNEVFYILGSAALTLLTAFVLLWAMTRKGKGHD